MQELSKGITLGWLKENFYVCPSSPSGLRWNVNVWAGRGRGILVVGMGDVCGHLTDKGYWYTERDGVSLACHRVVYMLSQCCVLESHEEVDHKDGDTQNNWSSNLRAVTKSVNARNRAKRSDNFLGITGVSLCMNNGKQYAKASWTDKDRVQRHKIFSVNANGYETAIELAKAHRDSMVVLLNNSGEGYTTRHGL